VRHVLSLAAALVLGPIFYLLLGKSLIDFRTVGDGWSGDMVFAVLLALIAGLAYAALLLPRLSPIGPAVFGVILLGLTLWAISDSSSFIDVMPRDLLDGAVFVPLGPVSVAAAVPLLGTVASGRRWSRTAHPRAAGPGLYGQSAGLPGAAQPPGYGTQPGTGQPGFGAPSGGPAYGTPSSGPPAYGTPSSGPPAYGTPSGGQPAYGTPSSGPPAYGTPSTSPPSSGPPAYWSEPAAQPAQYGQPAYPDQRQSAYGSPPGYPPDPMDPETTRRI
jgi:hypothetical protein